MTKKECGLQINYMSPYYFAIYLGDESKNFFSYFWIPAYAGMTDFCLHRNDD